MEEFEERFSTEIFLPRPDELEKKDQLEESMQKNARFLRESSSQIPATFQKERIKVRRRISERIKRKAKNKPPPVSSTSDPNPIEEHKLSLGELADKCETSIDTSRTKHSKGLTSEEAEQKLAKYGPNSLTPKKGTPMWVVFLRQFSGFLPVLLQIGGVLCFIAYILDKKHKDNLYLGIILWFEVIVSGIFSFLQEKKSAGVLEGFSKLAAQSANVIRNGKVGEVDAKTLVIGDIVIVKAGDRVPADIRIIFCNGLKVDNSSLTGEGEPQSRLETCTDESYLETKNLAFYGTLVQDGEALGVVIRTGDNTVLGRIAKLASKPKDTKAALEVEISKFIRIVTVFAVLLGILFVIMGFVNKLHWIIVIIFTIGIVVAQVPEGLLPTITVAMTLIAKKLSKKNVLVKSPAGIETLGSCTTIASDKTGTLTQNRMTVVHLWYDGQITSTDTILDNGKFDEKAPTFKEFFNIMALCNRAVFDDSDQKSEDRKILGDASESAILKFTESVHPVADYRAKNPKIFEIPFNSVNKWQLSVHSKPDKSIHLLIKGAPERIIDKCTHIMRDGIVVPMTDIHRSEFTKAYELFASRGERVLGFASLELDATIYPEDYKYNVDNPNFPTGEYVFVGLTGLMDPPKESVPGAIATCKEAGIRVVMVTGDHPLTAVAIAKQIGIISSDVIDDVAALRRQIMEFESGGIDMDRMSTDRKSLDRMSMDRRMSVDGRNSLDNRISIDLPRVMADLKTQQNGIVIKGSEIDDLTVLEWDYILSRKQIVFARTSPEQKYQIVENCQKRGEIVAVTGDGVNDSPALKKANLGCAMGISGNEVSKDAADVILLDDNFSSIVLGVEQGRIVFDNLRKAIAYTLSSNSCELVPFLAYLCLRMPLGLTPILVLCINLGTDLLTAISFAYESAEAGIMKRKPRSKKQKLVTMNLAIYSYLFLGSIQAIAGLVGYFVVFKEYGISGRSLVWLDLSYFEDNAADFYGYNASQQKNILKEAQTAFFIGIVLSRVAAAIVCKTRRTSVFKHGFSNKMFNIGLILEIVICVMVVYVPGIVDIFGTRPPTWKIWVVSLPIMAFIIVFDEVRKLLIRRFPHNKFARATYW